MYATGAEHTTLTPTHSMSHLDYQMLDIGRSAKDTLTVSSANYRNNNKINVDRTSRHVRNYDRSNEGYTGHSAESLTTSKYDMESLLETVDRKYQAIDDLDVPYYKTTDDSNRVLSNTNF